MPLTFPGPKTLGDKLVAFRHDDARNSLPPGSSFSDDAAGAVLDTSTTWHPCYGKTASDFALSTTVASHCRAMAPSRPGHSYWWHVANVSLRQGSVINSEDESLFG